MNDDEGIEPESRDVIDRINTLLPALMENLNKDERLPWISGITASDLTISRVPPTFVAGDAFEQATKALVRMNFSGKSVHASLIGCQLIFIKVTDESKLMMADFSWHDKRTGILGVAALELDLTGAITNVTNNMIYRDGDTLGEKDGRYDVGTGPYLQMLLQCMMLKNADDKEPASGTSCTVIDGIKLYEHRKIFTSDSHYMDAQVQVPPRSLPRLRDELVKEYKHYGANSPFKFAESNKGYFAEIGTALEQSQELWWVSEDMTKLAWDAAMSGTEPEDLSERELPSPAGIMWLNGGGGPVLMTKKFPDANFLDTGQTATELASLNAVIWYTPTVKMIPGVEVGNPRFMGLTASPGIVRDTAQWNGALSPMDLESNEMEFQRIPTYVTYYNLKFISRKIALLVMRLAREETIGEKTTEITGGGIAKKKKRNRRIDTITCTSLRRIRYASEADREAESRQYSHRWIVRGHMRNQPVGPRNTEGGQKHERVWIAPYVKGPEDKPLVLKDRVQLFRNSANPDPQE